VHTIRPLLAGNAILSTVIFSRFLSCPPGRIAKAGSGEEFSSLAKIRDGSGMVERLTAGRGGGKRRKEKTATRNGGIEDAGSFKKNGPILYFSGSLAQ